jgi:hypothetical protein
MDALGKNTQHALDAVRDLFVNVQVLLLEADALMREKKWVPKWNACTRGGSASIDWPRYWMPFAVWRYYYCKHANPQDLVPGVFVLLGDPDGGDRLVEPLAGGLLVKGKGAASDDPGMFGPYASGHLKASPETEHGMWGPCHNSFEKNHVREVTSFGVPLARLKNAVDLRQQVTDPLLQLIKGRNSNGTSGIVSSVAAADDEAFHAERP